MLSAQWGTSPNHSPFFGWSHSAARTQTLLGTETPSELDPSRLPSSDITVIRKQTPVEWPGDASTRHDPSRVGQLASRAN